MTNYFSVRLRRLPAPLRLIWGAALLCASLQAAQPGLAQAEGAGRGARDAISATLSRSEGGATLSLRFPRAAPPAHRIAAFDAPPRIVLDLEGGAWRLDAAPPEGATDGATEGGADAGSGPHGLRFGLVSPGWSRVVIDLDAPALPRRVETGAEGGLAWLALDLAETDAATFSAFAAMAPARRPSAPPAPRRADGRLVVAIDPGHGGADPGAVRDGLREKDLTLGFARDLAVALEARGFAAALTRDADEFVPLAERVARARAVGAALLLSIHADALEPGTGAASGASVYTLSAEASDSEAALLAARENQVDRLAGAALLGDGADLALALIDLVQRDTMAASQRLGATLIAELGARTPLLSGRPLRAAGFRVLKAPDIPSALIELGFLSSATDRARLRDPRWRALAAEGIAEAVRRWADEAPARGAGVAAAPQRAAD